MIKANDSDVVVIAMYAMLSLKEIGLEYLWIAYGQGKPQAGFQFIRLSKT